MLSQDLKPLPNSKCHCFLQKYKLRSKYRAILHFHVKEIPKLAGNSSGISFFSLWNNTDESTSKLCPPGFKLRLQLMTGVFQIQCLSQWVVHVMSKYFILKSPKGREKTEKKKKTTKYSQKNFHFSYTDLMRYSRGTCQHLQLQVYRTVIKNLAD